MRTFTARLTAAAATLAIAIAAGPALAQDDDTIVVEALRDADRSEVNEQTRAITPRATSVGQPLARFQRPICVGVYGMSGDSAALIADRIYYNAEAMGLSVDATPGCTANVIAAFVADPQAEFATLRARYSGLVEGLSYWEKKAVWTTDGPVLAWNVISTRTAGGQERSGNPPVFDDTQISRLNTGIRRDMELSIVMIDTDALVGVDGVAVADYVTMRALAKTRVPKADDANFATILTLFDNPGDAPARLTDFDRAYIGSLYASRENLPANMAFADMTQLMVEGRQER